MFVIGLVGGIASGKTLVSQMLESLGAGVLNADQAGHEVLTEPEVQAAIRERWGPDVFDVQGQVDRRALAQRVFAPSPAGPTELKQLEQITHPRIKARLEQRMETLAATGVEVAILDAPVLFKAGWNRLCDRIVFVDAPRATRLARARERGWSEAEFDRREAAQELLAWKQAQADAVIDNSTSVESTRGQVEQFWRSLPLAARQGSQRQ